MQQQIQQQQQVENHQQLLLNSGSNNRINIPPLINTVESLQILETMQVLRAQIEQDELLNPINSASNTNLNQNMNADLNSYLNQSFK